MDDSDWRLKVSSTIAEDTFIPWTGQRIKKGDELKVVSEVNLPMKKTLVLPLPSLTTLYINNSVQNWNEARAIRKENGIDSSLKKRVVFKSDKDAFDAIDRTVISVISAYTAIEAFCNDSIPEDHEIWQPKKDGEVLLKSDKQSIERNFSTNKKLTEVLPAIFNVHTPQGKNPVWSSYIKLKKMRDSLIHVKSKEVGSIGVNETNLWDKLFVFEPPYLLAKDVFDWYLKDTTIKPAWFVSYPK